MLFRSGENANKYHAGGDWMGETMWVALKDGVATDKHLWFEVTVGTDVWGCAATTDGAKNMFAFSFLNRTTQWEQPATGVEVGAGKPHAEKYLADKDVTEATLKVYVTDTEFTSQDHTLPTNATPIFNEKVAITKDRNTLVVVKDAPATPTEYTITKAAATNGVVTVSAEKAAAGTEVTITAIPDAGYEVDKITVVDADDTAVTVTEGKFTMPAKNVTVTVTFKQTTAPGAVVPKFTAATNAMA